MPTDWALRVARHAVHTRAAIQDERELASFLDVVIDSDPRIVVELGLSIGGMFYALSWAAHAEATMISIDVGGLLGDISPGLGELQEWCQPGQTIHKIEGYTEEMSTVKSLQRLLAGREIDLLFIDADHHYQSVSRDHGTYGKLVKQGGIIGFHDIARTEETQEGCEVDQYWRDLKQTWPESVEYWEWTYSRPGFGIGAYRKP